MMTIDDDMLMAFVDGELDEVSRARVERATAEDPAVKARLEQQQRLRARLAAHYGPAAEEGRDQPRRPPVLVARFVVRAAPRPARAVLVVVPLAVMVRGHATLPW